MIRPSRAAQAVADVAVQALSAPSGTDATPQIAEELVRLLHVDGVVLGEHVWRSWSYVRLAAPATTWEKLPMRRAPTQELAKIHPGVAFMAEHPVTEPIVITDVVAESEWQQCGYSVASRTHWGLNAQLAIPWVRSPERTFTWATSRDGRYNRADREIATAVQPVLEVVTRHMVAARAVRAEAAAAFGLTEREAVVFELMMEGRTAEAAARRLGISLRTVHKHLEHTYRKLGVRDRLAAVQVVSSQGMLTANEDS